MYITGILAVIGFLMGFIFIPYSIGYIADIITSDCDNILEKWIYGLACIFGMTIVGAFFFLLFTACTKIYYLFC